MGHMHEVRIYIYTPFSVVLLLNWKKSPKIFRFVTLPLQNKLSHPWEFCKIVLYLLVEILAKAKDTKANANSFFNISGNSMCSIRPATGLDFLWNREGYR